MASEDSRPTSRPVAVSNARGVAIGDNANVHNYFYPHATSAIPRQLPRDPPDFTGRGEAISDLVRLLRGGPDGPPKAMVISALAGKGGIGKTTLAVHLAHAVTDAFPDGQLYVNLRGAEGAAVAARSFDVLGEFLRALGVDGALLPIGEPERETWYRTRLAGRRILVVLDNAASEEQVGPLLPGDPSCAVIVTSRSPLALQGVHSLQLGLMTETEAVDLLRSIVGAARVDAEADEAVAIVWLCGRLPLAVRISGARLAQAPTWRLSRWRLRLDGERGRLRELRVGNLDVRASFNLSYHQGLTADQRRGFDVLGLIGAQDFPGWVLEPLLGCDPAEAEEIREAIVRAQLLEEDSVDGEQTRFGFHDLVRELSREHAGRNLSAAEQAAAIARMVDAYIACVAMVHALRDPTGLSTWEDLPSVAAPPDPAAAEIQHSWSAWFSAELPNLLDAVEQAVAHHEHRRALHLSRLVIPLLEVPSLWSEWADLADTGLRLARRLGERTAEAEMLRHRGEVSIYRGDRREAANRFVRSLEVLEGHPEDRARAVTLIRLGEALRFQGDTDGALRQMEMARRTFAELDDAIGFAYALVSIGGVHRVRMRWNDAIASFSQALPVLRASRHRRQTAIGLVSLGDVYHLKALWAEAMACFTECRQLFDDDGDRMWTANTDRHIGIVDFLQGRTADAERRFMAAAAEFEKIGDDRKRALTLWNMGELLIAEGRHDEAQVRLDAAYAIFDAMTDRFGAALVLTTIGQLCAARYVAGEAPDPRLTDGLAAAADLDHALLLAVARLNEAEVLLRQSHAEDAIRVAQASLDVSQQLGAPRWEAAALTLLARAHEQAGDRAAALARATEGLAVHDRFGLAPATIVERVLNRLQQ
jgi:tetratricopeptide (TPR) repeat protein